MEAFVTHTLEFLKGQSIQVAIVFVAVMILTWLLQNKSAHVRYLLWLLVAIKCLTPPLMIFSVPVLPAETLPVILPAQSSPIEHQQAPIIFEQPKSIETVTVVDKPQQTLPVSIESRKSNFENPLTSTGVLLSAWAAGAACYLLWALGKAVRLAVCLRRIRRPLPAQLMIEQIEMLTRLWDYPGGFNVWLVDGINQPFVWGLWRGAIYLPTRFQNIQGDKQKAIVLHEMAHVVRLDAFVNLIQILIQGVFWFHPLVWLANRAIRQEREKCCDEIAVARLGTAPKEYGSAIVDTLLQEAQAGLAIPTLAVAGPVKNIEDRIKTIMQPGRRFFRRPSTIALLVIGCLAAFVVPTTIALTQKVTPPDYPLSGIVTDANDNPIAGAIVFDDGYGPQPYQKGITDDSGKFEYKSWNEKHNITAKAEGFQPQTMTFTTFPLDNSKNLNFKLQPGKKTEIKIETAPVGHSEHSEESQSSPSFQGGVSRSDEGVLTSPSIMTPYKRLLKENEANPYFINFDTGNVATHVYGVDLKDEESIKKWARDNGYDAVVKFGEYPQLIGYDTTYLLAGLEEWEDMSVVYIDELARQKLIDTVPYHNGRKTFLNYALRTREGAIGWLRMATIDDKHPQSMVFEFNKLNDDYAKTKLAAFRKEQGITRLSFHILPNKEAVDSQSPMLSQEQIADYRMKLRTNGPAYGVTQKDEYRWLKSDHPQRPLPSEAITEEYSGMRYVLVCNWRPRAMLSGTQYPENWHLTKIEAVTDTAGHPAIQFELDEVGQEQMEQITGLNIHIGLSMAIVLNDNVIAAPRIQSKLSKQGMIVGSFTEDEVRQIVDQIKSSPQYKPSETTDPNHAPGHSERSEESDKLTLPQAGKGKLEFRIVSNMTPKQAQKASWPQSDVPGYKWFPVKRDENTDQQWPWYINMPYRDIEKMIYLLVSDQSDEILTADGGWGLQRAYITPDAMSRSSVGFDFDQKGTELFYQLTNNHLEKRLAILIDGTVYSAPEIFSAVRGRATISGHFDETEVAKLVDLLNAGMPPVVPLAENQQPGFAPVVEITVNDAVSVKNDSMIDFDTGKIFSMPEDFAQKASEEAIRWFSETGIDAVGASRETVKGLDCIDMIFIQVPSSYWDKMSASNMAGTNLWENGKPGRPAAMTAQGSLPATYLFGTQKRGMGILQILGFIQNPNGIKIRYKMLQDFKTVSLKSGQKTDVKIEVPGTLPLKDLADVKRNVSRDIINQRNLLLAEADQNIRNSLNKLSSKFPQLKKSEEYQNVVSQKSPSEQIRIWLPYSSSKKGGVSIPEDENFNITVIIEASPQRAEQLMMFALYPNIGLAGQIVINADNTALDQALKELVNEALKSLKELDESVSPRSGQNMDVKIDVESPDDLEIIEAIKAALPENYEIQKIERNVYPFYYSPGKGIALYLIRKGVKYVKQPYDDIIWLMPTDYGGQYISNESHAAVPPHFSDTTRYFKVYVWDCPDIVQKPVIEAIKKRELSLRPGQKTEAKIEIPEALKKIGAETNAQMKEAERNRIVSVPRWPLIPSISGAYYGFGNFSICPGDDRVGTEFSGLWKNIEAVEGKLSVPDGYALKLDIDSNNNTDLAALDHFGQTDLQVLALPISNKITSAALPHIGRLTGLQALFLGGAAICDEDIKNLAGLKNLKLLNLQNCPLTDDSIQYLSAMQSLTELNLWGTAITEQGYKKIKKILPQCDIRWKSEYIVALPNGVTVELLGICQHPGKGKQWWQPDGTLLKQPPFDVGQIDAKVADWFKSEYEFAMLVHNPSGVNAAFEKFQIQDSGSTGIGSINLGNRSHVDWFITSLPRNLSQTDLKIKIGEYWIAFKNVSLKPGRKTDVKTETQTLSASSIAAAITEPNQPHIALETSILFLSFPEAPTGWSDDNPRLIGKMVMANADSSILKKYLEPISLNQLDLKLTESQLSDADPNQFPQNPGPSSIVHNGRQLTFPGLVLLDGQLESVEMPSTLSTDKQIGPGGGVMYSVQPVMDTQNNKINLKFCLRNFEKINSDKQAKPDTKNSDAPIFRIIEIPAYISVPIGKTGVLYGPAYTDKDSKTGKAMFVRALLKITPTLISSQAEPISHYDSPRPGQKTDVKIEIPAELKTDKTYDEAFRKAIDVISKRENWPQTPEAVIEAYWNARAKKDYDETRILWPGSSLWDVQTFQKDPEVKYVFGPASQDGTEVPYAEENYYKQTGSYNLTMRLSSLDTKYGKRYYIWSGN
jgi:beta-lactamase regulating signal transducer with metallopeptidase domain/preprotein translocase subunit SecD